LWCPLCDDWSVEQPTSVDNPPKRKNIDNRRFTIGSFSGIEPFVAVAETRSFRAAAARLGVSTAAVSKAVRKLEDELGVPLLQRTTRHVSVTPEGEALLVHAREALDRLLAGLDRVARARGLAEGPLRVSVSPVLGRLVVGALPRLLQRHPGLVPDLSVTDRVVSLAEDEVDVAVRIGRLDDSSLIAHRLRPPRWVTVASPAYLARRGEPRAPFDLADHACLKYATLRGGVVEWTVARPGQTHQKLF
jgi:DNA-binding transcriptional LysR family regulator